MHRVARFETWVGLRRLLWERMCEESKESASEKLLLIRLCNSVGQSTVLIRQKSLVQVQPWALAERGSAILLLNEALIFLGDRD